MVFSTYGAYGINALLFVVGHNPVADLYLRSKTMKHSRSIDLCLLFPIRPRQFNGRPQLFTRFVLV